MTLADKLELERTQSNKAHFTGTHRTRSPAETLRRFEPLMPKFGITRLANITGLDYIGLPTYMAVRPNSRSLAVSQGKGLTRDAAKASALMETIEFWHAEHLDMALRYDSYAALRRRFDVIDIHRLPTRRGVPPRNDAVQLWVEGLDLMTWKSMWVPSACVTMCGTAIRSPTFVSSTNGLASGNTFTEAIVHAACELIERDAHMLWTLNHADPEGKGSQIDLATVTDPYCREVLGLFDAAGLLVAAYDMISDVEVPVYSAVISDRPGAPRALGYDWGMGSHLSPQVALARALTEAAQSRLTLLAGSRDDIGLVDFDLRDDDELREVERMITTPPPTRAFDSRTLASDDLRKDLEFIVERLRAANITSLVAVDLSRPEFDVPVVKLVATEMEFADTHTIGPRATAYLARSAG